MKRNNVFVVTAMGENKLLIPTGKKAIDFNGIIKINDTAEFLWNKCENDVSVDDLQKALMEEYQIDSSTAEKAVESFINQLKEVGCLE